MTVLLVASTGGHLAQLLELRDWWELEERHWVTFEKADAVAALEGEKVSWAHHPTTRNIPNALRNFGLAVRLMIRERPEILVSTGAGVALPFFVVARLLRIRTVYLEVFDRIELPTLTGRLCYPLSDAFLVQWPQQQQRYHHGTLVGTVY